MANKTEHGPIYCKWPVGFRNVQWLEPGLIVDTETSKTLEKDSENKNIFLPEILAA